MASWIWSAIPTPAVPAPNTSSFCPAIGTPVTFTADSAAASVIAPVPCMSSLKIRYWSP